MKRAFDPIAPPLSYSGLAHAIESAWRVAYGRGYAAGIAAKPAVTPKIITKGKTLSDGFDRERWEAMKAGFSRAASENPGAMVDIALAQETFCAAVDALLASGHTDE